MTHPYHNLTNLNQLGSDALISDGTNRNREDGDQSWVYPVSTTDQSSAWNNLQPNPLCQIPIFNRTNYPTVECHNVPEISYTSIPYTGFDPHTFAPVPSGHVQINIQPYNGGDIQSEGQATSNRYLDQQIPGNCQDTLQCHWKNCRHQLMFPDNKSLMSHVKMDHINPQCLENQESHGDLLKWKCNWKDCTTLFSKEASIVRHVKTLHIEKGAFPCPLCGHPSNRQDNLRNHITTVHRILAY